jgi:hypothetical protein
MANFLDGLTFDSLIKDLLVLYWKYGYQQYLYCHFKV